VAGRCSDASGRWPGAAVAAAARQHTAGLISPAVCCLARPASLVVSAMDSLMGAVPGGRGCPPHVIERGSLGGG